MVSDFCKEIANFCLASPQHGRNVKLEKLHCKSLVPFQEPPDGSKRTLETNSDTFLGQFFVTNTFSFMDHSKKNAWFDEKMLFFSILGQL